MWLWTSAEARAALATGNLGVTEPEPAYTPPRRSRPDGGSASAVFFNAEDRSIHFGLPNRSDRREIIDFYLDRKAHVPELDDPAARNELAASTAGYSPVMIEHLFDEGLVWALRRGADALDKHDLQQAKLTEEIGPVQLRSMLESSLEPSTGLLELWARSGAGAVLTWHHLPPCAATMQARPASSSMNTKSPPVCARATRL